MADSTVEVRLVRCPKCENLLQEPKDCSFFKCGGCGTILCCAKNKGNEADSKLDTNSVTNIAKETELNSSSSDEESCSDTSLRHKTSDSGLDRFRKRTTQRSNSEGFRFSASNNIQDSVSSDDDGLVQKLDKLKEHLLLQPKEKHTKAPLRFPSSGKHAPGPSYCSYNNNHDVSLHGPMHNQPYGDPHGYHMHERTDPRYSRQYIGNNNEHDMFNTHQRNGMLVQSKCSCFHCYDPYHRASGSAFPPSGLQDALHSVGFYSHERSTGFPSSLHSPRAFTTPHPLGYVLKSSISRLHRHKDASSSGCSRLIKPVAGGAPFMRCKNCSKLLKLPDKTDSAMRKQQRLRCGACSCLIDFSFDDDKKLILSTDLALPRKAETHHSKAPWVADVNFSSDDYDNDVYKFDTMDRGTTDLSTGPVSIFNKAQEVQIVDCTSPSVSEDELSSDTPSGRKVISDLPIHKHCDSSSINVRDRSESKNQSSRSEQDRVTLSKTATRQNSMKEASVAIEMDVNDYSQDSANEYREDNGRTKKSGFASIVKNSFKDLKKSIQNDGISEVSVNGHPLAERLVRMAEKQAGPIRPGNYWYDYRAGFWGVLGGPCLGILPPFIEELNYPMLENCAGGTTSVFVNGRELHQRDLRLLTSRGLPRDKDRSYTVYITGRVIDEDTGEELDSLGKLAPTVDKLKRGFGMRVPRRAA